MGKPHPFELYMNAKGRKPLTPLPMPDAEVVPHDKADLLKAIEHVVDIRNSFPKPVDSQVVVVQDGLIVAVEGLTTGKLIWCN